MYEMRVFYSHIEVKGYKQGDVPELEHRLSKYDSVTHSDVPISYFIYNDILYMPRGINLSYLKGILKVDPTIINRCDEFDKFQTKVQMTLPPRNELQEETIRFLDSEEEFTKGKFSTQLGLNLDPGMGKTYCMIHSIVDQRMKAIIITHKTSLKEQWYNEILDKTTFTRYDIMDLHGSDTMKAVLNGRKSANIYLVNHQTLREFGKREGYETLREFFKVACIGIKVVDECHKYFQSTLIIDYFSNVSRSYYLTATFSRSDPKEIRLFNQAFANMYRFGEESVNYQDIRKHTILFVIRYNSKPPVGTKINTAYGFSDYRFIDYAFKLDENNTLNKVLRRILSKIEKIEGKTLITSPKIESVEYVRDLLQENVEGTIGTIHSKNTEEENEEAFNCDYISSTITSLGEGNDIKKLRCLINIDPIGSRVLADQLRGRLREYSSDKDTLMFYPVDVGFREVTEMFNRIKPALEKKCKEIVYFDWFDL